jgi:hypothetical protein
MLRKPPLDDEIGRTYYINGAPWRLVYNPAIRGVALRRLEADIPFARALELIASGELHWDPFQHTDPFGRRATLETVQRYVALLGAFRRSPTCINATDWTLLARIDERLGDSRTWLARRALTSGDAPGDKAGGTE